jgi:transcriptional regulator with XRE-family HTH domain
MASLLGVTDQTVRNWENGTAHPGRSVLILWSMITRTPLEELTEGELSADDLSTFPDEVVSMLRWIEQQAGQGRRALAVR